MKIGETKINQLSNTAPAGVTDYAYVNCASVLDCALTPKTHKAEFVFKCYYEIRLHEDKFDSIQRMLILTLEQIFSD